VKFYSFGWTTDYFPKTEELKGYLQILKNAEFPVLVHCRTGADRTGEATAMYAIDFMHMPKQEAIDKFLSFKYWHVQMFHPAKAEFVRQYPGLDQALADYELCSPQYRKYAEPGRCPDESVSEPKTSSN
jgi:protein tyrosine/serine phosphatase